MKLLLQNEKQRRENEIHFRKFLIKGEPLCCNRQETVRLCGDKSVGFVRRGGHNAALGGLLFSRCS